MYHMQVTEALGQKQIRLDITAAVGSCFGKSSNDMSTHQDLIPKSHTRTCKRISTDRQRRTFYTSSTAQGGGGSFRIGNL